MRGLARVAVVASSIALMGFEASIMQSPKPTPSETLEQAPQVQGQRVSCQEAQNAKREELKAVQRRSAPKMAPQFDGLNFYETFIGATQR